MRYDKKKYLESIRAKRSTTKQIKKWDLNLHYGNSTKNSCVFDLCLHKQAILDLFYKTVVKVHKENCI